MNCEPGDTAFIVAPYLDVAMRGLPVHVVCADSGHRLVEAKNGARSHGRGHQCWLVDGHDVRLPMVIGDQYLRPIRDPGEGAMDEVLQRLGLPEDATV